MIYSEFLNELERCRWPFLKFGWSHASCLPLLLVFMLSQANCLWRLLSHYKCSEELAHFLKCWSAPLIKKKRLHLGRTWTCFDSTLVLVTSLSLVYVTFLLYFTIIDVFCCWVTVIDLWHCLVLEWLYFFFYFCSISFLHIFGTLA